MPNWCDNELSVKGEISDVAAFIEFVRSEGSALDFDKIRPMPEVFNELHSGFCKIDGNECRLWRVVKADGETANVPISDEEQVRWRELYGYDNWYDWSRANWGTKWNAGQVDAPEVNDDCTRAEYRFDTAWSPPEPLIPLLHERFPNLRIKLKYWEGGGAFKGVLEYGKKGLIRRDQGTYYGPRGG